MIIMRILNLACPKCGNSISFIRLGSDGRATCKKCKTTLIARNYHRDLGVANAVFFLAALPINALLFKSWIFWMMDFLSALIITSIFLRRVELEIDHDLVD